MAVDGIMKKTRKKKHLGLYTTGELNKIVDDFVHPFFDKEKSSIVLDGVAHALLEQDVRLSVRKFIRYDLLKLLKQSSKKRMAKQKRPRK